MENMSSASELLVSEDWLQNNIEKLLYSKIIKSIKYSYYVVFHVLYNYEKHWQIVALENNNFLRVLTGKVDNLVV